MSVIISQPCHDSADCVETEDISVSTRKGINAGAMRALVAGMLDSIDTRRVLISTGKFGRMGVRRALISLGRFDSMNARSALIALGSFVDAWTASCCRCGMLDLCCLLCFFCLAMILPIVISPYRYQYLLSIFYPNDTKASAKVFQDVKSCLKEQPYVFLKYLHPLIYK